MGDLDLDALEALLAKVPPAPWTDTALPPDADGPAKGWSPSVLIAATSAGSGNKVFAVPSGGVSPPAVQRAIIALRNAAPALLAAARERDALRALLKEVRDTMRPPPNHAKSLAARIDAALKAALTENPDAR